MNERARRGMSRFHAWRGGDASAITPDDLESYIAYLQGRVRPKTAMEYLWGLLKAIREQCPAEDWAWMERRLRSAWMESPARPRRNGPGRGSVNRARRHRLLVAEWPPAMREAWRAARAGAAEPVSLLDEIEGRVLVNDIAVGWSHDTVEQRERAMGYFLRHLTDAGKPLAVTAVGVESYIAAMRQADLAPKTVATRIVAALRMAEAMWPEQGWRWLQDRAYGLSRMADGIPGVRNPATQFIPIKDLRACGQRLMRTASLMPKGRRAAAKFQEGLIITFLTHHPVRRRNLTRMEVLGPGFATKVPEGIGRLQVLNDGFNCVWPRTKSRPRAERLARPLVGPMLEWLTTWRPYLAGPASGQALWLSNSPGFIGAPLSEAGMSDIVRRVTTSGLGLKIAPHAFRHIVATTIVNFAPERVGVISTLLGHRNPASKRAYVQAANSVIAARLFEQIVQVTAKLDEPDLTFLPARRYRLGRASGR